MPFPFIPFGALMAALVMGGTFALFFAVVNKVDRTIADVGGVVVGRLVSGFDDWSHERASAHGRDDSPGTGVAAGDSFEAGFPVPVEPARVVRR
jgi:hypothetical protein